MKSALLIASGILLAAFAPAVLSAPAQAKTMKECAAQWQEMKAAGQTGGMKYRDFTKQCMTGEAPAAAAPPPQQPEAAPPPAAEPAAKPSGVRAAMVARLRACGAEWKTAKAAGNVPAGQKWPQFWSACNKRKKAEGM
jgi:protein-disulfide isomerase